MVNYPIHEARSVLISSPWEREGESFPQLICNINSFIDESEKVIDRVNREIKKSNKTLDKIAEDSVNFDVLADVEDVAINDLKSINAPENFLDSEILGRRRYQEDENINESKGGIFSKVAIKRVNVTGGKKGLKKHETLLKTNPSVMLSHSVVKTQAKKKFTLPSLVLHKSQGGNEEGNMRESIQEKGVKKNRKISLSTTECGDFTSCFWICYRLSKTSPRDNTLNRDTTLHPDTSTETTTCIPSTCPTISQSREATTTTKCSTVSPLCVSVPLCSVDPNYSLGLDFIKKLCAISCPTCGNLKQTTSVFHNLINNEFKRKINMPKPSSKSNFYSMKYLSLLSPVKEKKTSTLHKDFFTGVPGLLKNDTKLYLTRAKFDKIDDPLLKMLKSEMKKGQPVKFNGVKQGNDDDNRKLLMKTPAFPPTVCLPVPFPGAPLPVIPIFYGISPLSNSTLGPWLYQIEKYDNSSREANTEPSIFYFKENVHNNNSRDISERDRFNAGLNKFNFVQTTKFTKKENKNYPFDIASNTDRSGGRGKFFNFAQLIKLLGNGFNFVSNSNKLNETRDPTVPIVWFVYKNATVKDENKNLEKETMDKEVKEVTLSKYIYHMSRSGREEKQNPSTRQPEAKSVPDFKNVQVYVLEPDQPLRMYDLQNIPDSIKAMGVSNLVLI